MQPTDPRAPLREPQAGPAADAALALHYALLRVLTYAERWGAVESGRPGYRQYAQAIADARALLGLPARGAA